MSIVHAGSKSSERSYAPRDHSGCAHDPDRLDRSAPLTPSRQRILDELCAAGQPLGAYQLIDRLGERYGKRPAPISIYRALDFLVENGLVHRLASRNAFMACASAHEQAEPVIFLICDVCGGVTEATSKEHTRALRAAAADAGFVMQASTVELVGRCSRCESV